jgi:hypothetical protein
MTTYSSSRSDALIGKIAASPIRVVMDLPGMPRRMGELILQDKDSVEERIGMIQEGCKGSITLWSYIQAYLSGFDRTMLETRTPFEFVSLVDHPLTPTLHHVLVAWTVQEIWHIPPPTTVEPPSVKLERLLANIDAAIVSIRETLKDM